MNPFNFYGPQFLVFYAALLVILSIGIIYWRNLKESSADSSQNNLTDPYLIAYLRGRCNEALRVAVISLIDRGLLKVDEKAKGLFKKEYKLEVTKQSAGNFVNRLIEKAIIRKFEKSDNPTAIFSDADLASECEDYETKLTEWGLLPDENVKFDRMMCYIFSLCIAWGFAITKIVIALSRGRHNIMFLILLAVVYSFLAYRIANPFRTKKGNLVLKELRQSFSGLKERADTIRPGGATNEAALLAAIFGLALLPVAAYSYIKKIYPKAYSSQSPWSSGCGTSGCGFGTACGSGTSCGSGGSCGGGGCGGGCGGCGG